jgi:GT2 family glycosyltransferase
MIKSSFNYEASVIVMNRNRIELLKQCLESIERYSKDVRYELIIVDSLSNDGSRDYLLANWVDRATLIFEHDDTSYAASNNRAMKWSYGEYIYLMNNDCEARSGWLRNAIDFARDNKDVGHIASLVLWPDGRVMSHGANLLSSGCTDACFRGLPEKHPELKNPMNFAYAGFGLYRKDLCEKLNYLPEYPVPIYFDDTAYSMEVWRAGYDVRYCPSSTIIHKLYHDENRKHHKDAVAIGLKSFNEDWGEFLKENNGFKPDFPFTGKRPYKNGDKK